MSAQERAQERNRKITRRAVVVALLAATAATGAVFLIKQDARGASAAAAAGGPAAIVGGEDAPNDKFPWMVSLRDPTLSTPGGHFCGGSLIRPDTVLTAGHCFMDEAGIDNFVANGTVVIGGYNNSRADSGGTVGWEPESRSIASAVLHPEWDSGTLLNDIAIVKLTEPSSLPLMRLASETPEIGTSLTAMGWGITDAQPSLPCDDDDDDGDDDGDDDDGDDDWVPDGTTAWYTNWYCNSYDDEGATCLDLETDDPAGCWDRCETELGAELAAADYDQSKDQCCCHVACECRSLSPSTCYLGLIKDTAYPDDDWFTSMAGQCDGPDVFKTLPSILQIVGGLKVKDPNTPGCIDPDDDEGFHVGLEICAGAPPKKDVCQGDSGGPLLMKDGGYTQVGIVSRGDGCASYAGVYTDVAAYRDWIEAEAGPSCEDDEDWHKTDEPDKDCEWVGGKPETRCAVKGPGWGQDNLRAAYACPGVCGGTCKDSGSWTKTGGEDWKGCAWVSIFPEARCKVWGEEPGEEDKVLAATACPDSCA